MLHVFASAAFAFALATLPGSQALAQDSPPYPAKQITLVVPFAAGGGTDVAARLVADKLQRVLGQQVLVDYRPGANGAIANRHVLAQAADGYTLLFGSYSTHVVAPLAAHRSAGPVTQVPADFTAVSVVAYVPLVLAVEARSTVDSLSAWLIRAKAKPVTFGTFGVGSSAQVLGELLASASGARLVHVPYKGSAPATTDLLGQHVDSVVLTVPAIVELAHGDRVRALAVSSGSRLRVLPGVPTFSESGFPQLANTGWFAVFVAGKTPEPIVVRLSGALAKVVADAGVRDRLGELGLEPVGSTSEEARTIWQRSLDAAKPIVSRLDMEQR